MAIIDKKNLAIRVAVAAVAIPLLLFLAKAGNLPFVGLVGLAAFLGMLEFSKIASGNQTKIHRVSLGVVLVVTLVLAYYQIWSALPFVFLVTFFALTTVLLKLPVEEAVKRLAFSLLAVAYLSLFVFWILIRELPRFSSGDYASGGFWMISLFLIVWSCDTAAYFGGKWLGKHQLAPSLSPSKTREGSVFGILGALVAAGLIHFIIINSLRLFDLLIVALLVGTIGQLGDLFESLLKRSAQLKDTSTIIPGHGGVLDRFDSLLFVAPWVYLYLRWFVYGN